MHFYLSTLLYPIFWIKFYRWCTFWIFRSTLLQFLDYCSIIIHQTFFVTLQLLFPHPCVDSIFFEHQISMPANKFCEKSELNCVHHCYLPLSTISPSFSTKISSASIIVDSLWATTTVVLLVHILFRESWMFRSVWVSKALVASSKRIIVGAFSKVLAIATLCFSPPLSLKPLSPTWNFIV